MKKIYVDKINFNEEVITVTSIHGITHYLIKTGMSTWGFHRAPIKIYKPLYEGLNPISCIEQAISDGTPVVWYKSFEHSMWEKDSKVVMLNNINTANLVAYYDSLHVFLLSGSGNTAYFMKLTEGNHMSYFTQCDGAKKAACNKAVADGHKLETFASKEAFAKWLTKQK